MFELQPWLAALGAIVALSLVTWLVSVVRRDVSIVDVIWSLMFLAAAAAYYLATDPGPRALLVLLLVSLWALRLAGYIAWRGHGEPEDYRYRTIRANNQPAFAWKSLYLVFGFQALLAWIISLPLLAAINGVAPLGWLDAIGVALWLAGMVFEAGADLQLARFKASPANRGRVLDSGLWRFSRHPNYFGNFCIWWGFFFLALAAGGWWSVVSPLLMTVLLLKVSGVALLEKTIGERRPRYREYVQNTNAFFPGPSRQGGGDRAAPGGA